MARIIDSVLVDNDRGDQSTELDQHMPVAAIAGETRALDREHRADVSGADCSSRTSAIGAGDAASRAAKVIIDDLDASPAELPSAIGERILSALALLVVDQLIGRRLANVDVGGAREVLSGDLGHGQPPWLRAPRRSRSAGLRSASSAVVAGPVSPRFLAGFARTARVVCFRVFWNFAAWRSSPISESDGSAAKTASTSTRRDRRNAIEIVGDRQRLCCAADSASIHAGRQASEPSGCKMTAISTLCVKRRLLTMTASPNCVW